MLQQADIGIIPIDTSNGESDGNAPPSWMGELERRLTLKLMEAQRDPGLRRSLGEQARASVAEKYSKKEQARLLAEVFNKVLSGSAE